MGAEDQVVRPSVPKAFIEITGDAIISRLVKSFLESQGYRVEYLAKLETKTLKVYYD